MFHSLLLDDPVCNYHCEYCGLKATHDNNLCRGKSVPTQIRWDIIDKELDDMYVSKGLKVKISIWSGEPFFNQHIWEVLDHLKDNYDIESVSTVTNGSLLYGYRDVIKKYPWLSLNVSNDLMYQNDRGPQYLDRPEVSVFFKELIDAGMIDSIQTVVSGRTSHVMDNLHWMQGWAEKYHVDWKKLDWFLMPARDYTGVDKSLILSLDDKEFERQFYEYNALCLTDGGKTKTYRSHYGRLRTELIAMQNPNGKEYRPQCESFRNNYPTFLSTSGERYYCTENFDNGIKVNNINPPSKKCLECVFQQSCNGMCANLPTKAREASCPGMKAWHGIMQKVLYRGMNDEQRKIYADLFGASDMFGYISDSGQD